MRFVHECAVQFNTEDFHFGNLFIEENFGKCHGKFRILFPVCFSSSKSSESKSCRSLPTPNLICDNL